MHVKIEKEKMDNNENRIGQMKFMHRIPTNTSDIVARRGFLNTANPNVIQRVQLDGIEVVKNANMPQWQQEGYTWHLNVTTDPSHITCEDWPAPIKSNKNRTTKQHFFFQGEPGQFKNAVSGQRGKKKFTDLPTEVQQFVNKNYMAMLDLI
jgi:hypothetical protein